MTRLVRRIAACLAVAALAFSQLAVSSYACGRDMILVADSVVYMAPAWDDADDAAPALCRSHCNQAPQTVDKAQIPDIPAPASLAFAPIWSHVDGFASLLVPASLTRPLAGTSEPTLAIRNCRFRL